MLSKPSSTTVTKPVRLHWTQRIKAMNQTMLTFVHEQGFKLVEQDGIYVIKPLSDETQATGSAAHDVAKTSHPSEDPHDEEPDDGDDGDGDDDVSNEDSGNFFTIKVKHGNELHCFKFFDEEANVMRLKFFASGFFTTPWHQIEFFKEGEMLEDNEELLSYVNENEEELLVEMHNREDTMRMSIFQLDILECFNQREHHLMEMSTAFDLNLVKTYVGFFLMGKLEIAPHHMKFHYQHEERMDKGLIAEGVLLTLEVSILGLGGGDRKRGRPQEEKLPELKFKEGEQIGWSQMTKLVGNSLVSRPPAEAAGGRCSLM